MTPNIRLAWKDFGLNIEQNPKLLSKTDRNDHKTSACTLPKAVGILNFYLV